MTALRIRDDLSADELRRRARADRDGRVAARMFAIAHALDGMSREQAARLAGMDRQVLRDWVVRYNAEGVAGLHNRPLPGPRPKLTEGEMATLRGIALRAPDPAKDGTTRWRMIDLCRIVEERFGVRYCETGMWRLVRSLGLSFQKARPRHPQADLKAQAAFKGGLANTLNEIRQAHPEASRLEVWAQDEARIGQQGRAGHLWFERGQRPTATRDMRRQSAWIVGAVCPARDTGVALVMTRADTAVMNRFLAELAAAVAPGAHAVVLMDGAGWHIGDDLVVPKNLTPVFLPAYSPELNPVERVWLHIRDTWIGHRVFADLNEVIDVCCEVWNCLLAEAGRIRSLCSYAWITAAVNA